MKRQITLLLLMTAALTVRAQQPLFDGGMMLHTGYMHNEIAPLNNYQAQGMTFGLGGVLRFHVGDHLRVGGEGYVSTLSQMDNGSYVRIGCGGAVADMQWHLGRWMPYVGLTAGGGSVSTLLLFAGSETDWEAEPHAVLHNESFMMVNPYAGVEYALTDAVHLTFKADRMLPLTSDIVPTGLRIHLGFIFCH